MRRCDDPSGQALGHVLCRITAKLPVAADRQPGRRTGRRPAVSPRPLARESSQPIAAWEPLRVSVAGRAAVTPLPYRQQPRLCRLRGDEVVTALGYEHLRRHDLRHTGLTWMADAGVPVHVLRKIAGHGSLVTTQRYLHSDAQSIADAGTALSAHLTANWSPNGPQLQLVKDS